MSNVGYNGQVSLAVSENSTYQVISGFGNVGDAEVQQTVSHILSVEELIKGIQVEHSIPGGAHEGYGYFIDLGVFRMGIDVGTLRDTSGTTGRRRDKLDEIQGVRHKLEAFELFFCNNQGLIILQYHSNGRLKATQTTQRAQMEKATNADVISFSGCRDDQTSADTMEGSMAVGAMSCAFVKSFSCCLQRIHFIEIQKFTIHDIQQRSGELNNPRLTHKNFVSTLHITPDSPDEVSIALTIIGHELNENDVQSAAIKCYIFATLDELRDDGICVARTPVVNDIVGLEMSYHLMEDISPAPRSPSASNIEKEVLKHRNKTVTTPAVGRVAQRLFEEIKVARKLMDEDMHILDDVPRNPSIIHAANPNSVQWLDSVDDHLGFYGSVLMDAVKSEMLPWLYWRRRGYYSCKILQVPLPPVNKQTRRQLLVGHYLVCLYLFEDEGFKKFHAQRFTHTSLSMPRKIELSVQYHGCCNDIMALHRYSLKYTPSLAPSSENQ
ncbi:hypothetical protein BD769DRAFT_1388857 [Suillus cothurnatus]|nr:hypothetical protein BD769DRAFT_1388857 [Suillus cothurnatus]